MLITEKTGSKTKEPSQRLTTLETGEWAWELRNVQQRSLIEHADMHNVVQTLSARFPILLRDPLETKTDHCLLLKQRVH